MPDDFFERYCEMGWEAEYYYATNWRVMRRWVREYGHDKLRAARKAWLAKHGQAGNHVRHIKGFKAVAGQLVRESDRL